MNFMSENVQIGEEAKNKEEGENENASAQKCRKS